MKSYSKEVYIMEFEGKEIEVLGSLLQRIYGNVELNDEELDLVSDMLECIDGILHP